MSHIVKIKTEIKNLDTIRRVCQTLNLQTQDIAEGLEIFTPNTYRKSIVVRNQGDHYELEYDSWGWPAELKARLGDSCGRLLQLYAVQEIQDQAIWHGYSIEQQTLQDGSIKIMLYEKEG